MSKALSRNEVVPVNFTGRLVHATIVGVKDGILQANVSPYGGVVPLYTDDGSDHDKDVHACYYTPDEDEESAAPAEKPFTPTVPAAKPASGPANA